MGYNAKDIKVLGEIQVIRTNPGMFIGNTSTPTHLIEEALDNALDECSGGHANIVAVDIDTENFVYTVMDNGRGMPMDKNVPVTVSTKLYSGAKFKGTKKKETYEICSGLHGVGLVAVNALSSKYEIEIYRDNKHATFLFEDTKFIKKTRKKHEGEYPFSTKISFCPDSRIFESMIPNIDRIRKRMLIASIELVDCTCVLTVNGEREIIKDDKETHFTKQCNGDDLSDTFSFNASSHPEKFDAMFCYSYNGSVSPKIISSVNLLPVDGGGTHINMFFDIIKNYFYSKAKKAGLKIQPQDTLCGLRVYLSLSLIQQELGGQTKDKLINRKTYLDPLIKSLKTQIEKYFNNNEEQLTYLLEHFQSYRSKLDSKAFKKNTTKRASTKLTKLRDCSLSGGDLFIVEGESAEGTFLDCRNPRHHAILPLKGKIPSAATKTDILKNKEIKEMIQSFGTGYGDNFDINSLKYNRIIIACDADPDGKHIAALVILAIAVLVPEIIQNGNLFVVETPLYAINDGKSFIPIWNETELEDAKLNKKKITRFKGLGELNPEQLHVVAIDENVRNLIKVEYTSDMKSVIKLFSKSEEKRKLLLGDHYAT